MHQNDNNTVSVLEHGLLHRPSADAAYEPAKEEERTKQWQTTLSASDAGKN
jgi:hypothetical protein